MSNARDDALQVGNIGVAMMANFINPQSKEAINISTALILEIKFQKPDKSTINKTANIWTDGLDGKAIYITTSGFLDLPGQWESQGYVEFSNGDKLHSGKDTFFVKDNL